MTKLSLFTLCIFTFTYVEAFSMGASRNEAVNCKTLNTDSKEKNSLACLDPFFIEDGVRYPIYAKITYNTVTGTAFVDGGPICRALGRASNKFSVKIANSRDQKKSAVLNSKGKIEYFRNTAS